MVPPTRFCESNGATLPYANLMAQRRPLQTKHTFSTKPEVHFYIGYTPQFLAHISNGPLAGFCESNDTVFPLCGVDGPEKTSPEETYIFDPT